MTKVHSRRSLVDAFQWPKNEAVSSPPDGTRPHDVLSALRVAGTRERKRASREWEQARRSSQVSYRSFPPEIREGVRKLAAELGVSVDETARALLEFGLAAHRAGNLPLWGDYRGTKLTLFAEEKSSPSRRTRRIRRGSGKEPRWKTVVTYRGIPREVSAAVREVAQKRSVPVGETAAALIGHALERYRSGVFQLSPEPQPGVKQTLFGE